MAAVQELLEAPREVEAVRQAEQEHGVIGKLIDRIVDSVRLESTLLFLVDSPQAARNEIRRVVSAIFLRDLYSTERRWRQAVAAVVEVRG